MDKSPARVPPHLHRCSTIAAHGSYFPFPTSGTPLPPAVSKVWYLVISAIGGWEGGGGGTTWLCVVALAVCCASICAAPHHAHTHCTGHLPSLAHLAQVRSSFPPFCCMISRCGAL